MDLFPRCHRAASRPISPISTRHWRFLRAALGGVLVLGLLTGWLNAATVTFNANTSLYAQWLQTPQNLVASVLGKTVTLSWSLPTGGVPPNTLNLQYRPSGQSIWQNFPVNNLPLPTTATPTTLSGLTGGTSDDLRVQSQYGNINGNSDIVTTSTANVPGAPTQLALKRTGSTSLTATWVSSNGDGGSPILSYKVMFVLPNTNAWTVLGTCAPASGTSQSLNIDYALPYGTMVYLAVVASNAAGDSDGSFASYTAYTTPGNIPWVKGKAEGGGWALLKWSAPSYNDGNAISLYNTYQRLSGQGNFLDYSNHGIQDHLQQHMKLSRGAWTRYDIGVKAQNDAGEGPISYDTVRNH
jgi:hypothetical protein